MERPPAIGQRLPSYSIIVHVSIDITRRLLTTNYVSRYIFICEKRFDWLIALRRLLPHFPTHNFLMTD